MGFLDVFDAEKILRRKRSSESIIAIATTINMSTASISSGSSQHTSLGYSTGFPDRFAERTTSRRHPEAKIGEGAFITAEDIDIHRALLRGKHHLLIKHRRTISHGSCSPSLDKIPLDRAAGAVESLNDAEHVDASQTELLTPINSVLHRTDSESPTSSPTDSHMDDKKSRRRRSANIFRWRSLRE